MCGPVYAAARSWRPCSGMRFALAMLAVTIGGLIVGLLLIWATQFFDDPLSF